MISVFSSIKEVLAFTVICIVCGTGNTKDNHDFKISFKDSKHHLAIHHEITKAHHKITVGPDGAPGKAKVITLPRPMKGNWMNKVKLENSKGKGKGKKVGGKGKKAKDKKAKGKKAKGKKAKGKKDKGKKAKGKKGKGKKAKGKKNKSASGRIVGGNEVEPPHALPWQVAYVQKRNPTFTTCGATIICPKYILFAAHCIEEVIKDDEGNDVRTGKISDVDDFLIVAGAHNMQDRSESSRTEHRIKKFTIHPKRTDWTYDFAIIELADKIKMRPEARAAFLPKESDQKKLPSKTMLVSGWGDLKDNARLGSALLMYAKVPYVPDSKCYYTYGNQMGETKDSAFCAGYFEEGGIDACQGDSGGPLTMLDEGKVKLIGVVSAGGECAKAHQPGLYAKTTLVLDWIDKVTGRCNAKTCKKGNCVTGEDLGPAQRYFIQ